MEHDRNGWPFFNEGIGPIKTVGGYLALGAAGAFMTFAGFAPILNERVRQRWCKPDAQFEHARSGLLMMGLIGSFLAIGGFSSATVTKYKLHVPHLIEEYGFYAAMASIVILYLLFKTDEGI